MVDKKKINLNEKIFIAGGSGMVGSATNLILKKNGYGSNTYGGEILTPNRKELNLLDSNQVNSWFTLNKPSVVIMAAAKVGGIVANQSSPYEFLLENLTLQNNVINASFKNGVKRFLFLGSSCIYPKFATNPIKEESLLSGALEKTNESYALAKIAGIKLCNALREQYEFDAISLMPTNLYGPGDNYHPTNSHVMAAFIRKFLIAKKDLNHKVTCWGTGKALREFLHVYDLASAIIFALEYWSPNDKNAPKDSNGNPLFVLNVGSGEEISIKDLSNKVAKASLYEGEIEWDLSKPDGTPRKKLDISRLSKMGWNAKIKLDIGIEQTISEQYKNNNFQ